MTLKLHLHPFASYCQKVIVAFYENGTPFEACFVDLGEEISRAAFLALWPMGKMPVLQDDARGETIPETSIVIEYLELHYPGATRLIPVDPDLAWRTRLMDRMFDLYVQSPMQAIVADRIRPHGERETRRAWRRRGPNCALSTACLRRNWPEGPGRWARPLVWPTAPRRRRCSMSGGWNRSATTTQS